MDLAEFGIHCGSLAMILSTISALPQLIKIIRMKETRDLSLISMLIGLTAGSLWLTYAVFGKFDYPVMITNIVGLTVGSIILILKLKYDGILIRREKKRRGKDEI